MDQSEGSSGVLKLEKLEDLSKRLDEVEQPCRSRSPLTSRHSLRPTAESDSPRSRARHRRNSDTLSGQGAACVLSGLYGQTEDEEQADQREDESVLRPVPERTRRFLTERFSKPLPNEARLRVRRQFALPDVEATKVPQTDFFVKSHASNAAKSTDRELAKLQALINDGIAPITAILTKGDKEESMSGDEVLKAAESAAELLGNASAKLSQLRREKLTSDFNKSLLPLVKSGMDFSEASPRLFGAEFAKLAKEHVEEMKALKSTLPSRSDSQPFFRSGPSRRGGSGRYRSNEFANSSGSRQFGGQRLPPRQTYRGGQFKKNFQRQDQHSSRPA